jgi:CRP-like cAMP-binding protein
MPDARPTPPGPPTGNLILDRLPAAELARLRPQLEAVPLAAGDQLMRPHGPIRWVYFPTRGVCSQIVRTDSGMAVEVMLIGREEMIGTPVFLGQDDSPAEVLVKVPGAALRMEAVAFRRALARPDLDRLVRGYVAAVLGSLGRIAACNLVHSVEQRLSRWLLMTADRVGGGSVALTQESLAELLGVQRPTVSLAARTLQEAGLIAYRRGTIRVTDRPGLEAASCECYAAIKSLYDEHVR